MRAQTVVRQALSDKLHAGATGTYDVLAALAQVPAGKAKRVLHGMRQEGCVSVVGRVSLGRVGRPRAVYGWPVEVPCGFDALSFVRQAWR